MWWSSFARSQEPPCHTWTVVGLRAGHTKYVYRSAGTRHRSSMQQLRRVAQERVAGTRPCRRSLTGWKGSAPFLPGTWLIRLYRPAGAGSLDGHKRQGQGGRHSLRLYGVPAIVACFPYMECFVRCLVCRNSAGHSWVW